MHLPLTHFLAIWSLYSVGFITKGVQGKECAKDCPAGTSPDLYQAYFYVDKEYSHHSSCCMIDLRTDAAEKTMVDFMKKNKFSSFQWYFPKGYGMTVLTGECSVSSCGEKFTHIYKHQGIELMGTGQLEGFPHLHDYLNNEINQWAWFTYDTNVGYVDVYTKTDFDGPKRSLVLDFFDPKTLVEMDDWNFKNDLELMDWSNIGPFCQLTMYAKNNGGAVNPFSRAFGWSHESRTNLHYYNFANANSYLIWSQIKPVKEVFNVANSSSVLPALERTLYKQECKNVKTTTSSISDKISIEIDKTLSFATQVENSDTIGQSITAFMGVTPSSTTGGVSELTTVSFSSEITESETSGRTQTDTVGLTIEQDYTVPSGHPHGTVCMSIYLDSVPYTTLSGLNSTRWYAQPVKGGVRDPDYFGYYKIETEKLTEVSIAGTASLYVEMEAFDSTEGSDNEERALVVRSSSSAGAKDGHPYHEKSGRHFYLRGGNE